MWKGFCPGLSACVRILIRMCPHVSAFVRKKCRRRHLVRIRSASNPHPTARHFCLHKISINQRQIYDEHRWKKCVQPF